MQKKCSAASMLWNDTMINVYFGLTIPARLVWDRCALPFSRLHGVLQNTCKFFLFFTQKHFGFAWFCELLFHSLRCQLASIQVSGQTVKDVNPYTPSPLPWWLTFIVKVQLLRAGRLLRAVAILTFAGGANLLSKCSFALYSTACPALWSMKSFNWIMYQDLQKKIVSANNEFMSDRHTVSIIPADTSTYLPHGLTSKANLLRLASWSVVICHNIARHTGKSFTGSENSFFYLQ